jgi:ATP-dependent DNA helicase RecQ
MRRTVIVQDIYRQPGSRLWFRQPQPVLLHSQGDEFAGTSCENRGIDIGWAGLHNGIRGVGMFNGFATIQRKCQVSHDSDIHQLLQQHFGYDSFRPGQQEVIAALLERCAALAVFPTGAGKSLCYQLPALALSGVTLVVSPLIALMKDQIDYLHRRGIAAARLDSSLTAAEAQTVSEQVRAGTLKLLYVAPERFNNERFLALLKQSPIALFTVDEAHCISEWGHNFRPDYLKLADTARALKVPRVLALTATATPSVVADICAAFSISAECAVITGFHRPNLNLAATPTRSEDRDALLLKRLRSRPPGPTIIYVTLQKTAERVASEVQRAGFEARAYHAGIESEARSQVQEWWMAGDNRIVVATIAFGMGIDKADVRYVYHYNLPKSLESYSQEIGRAGRDGAKSTVEMLACPEDVATLENFVYGDTPTEAALRGMVRELLALGGADGQPQASAVKRPAKAARPAAGSQSNPEIEGGAPEFDLNLLEFGNRHDLRPLVLRTALTYLELRGLLRQGTPRYVGYAIKLVRPVPEIVAQFKGEPAQLVAEMFARAEKGRVWFRLNPDEMAVALGQERRRIVRALEVLEEKSLVELTASDVRHTYTLLDPAADADEIAADLAARFARREAQEIGRMQDVLALVTHDGCQTNRLIGYFGELREEPCGHCTHCVTGRVQRLPSVNPLPPMETAIDLPALEQIIASHPDALSEPRQIARFLCGLTTPALTRAKLPRDPLFGRLEAYRFAEVLERCSGIQAFRCSGQSTGDS